MDGLLIVEIVFGFFAFCMIVAGIVMWIFWNRRKLIFTNFLSPTGHWEREGWKPDKVDKDFQYQDVIYEYDIEQCTRDFLNRPIAHYYKGNPKQLQFNFSNTNKSMIIEGEELTPKDFVTLMKSKVLRDIFLDDEVMNLLYIIIGVTVICAVIIGIMVATHNPACTLKDNNQTITMITRACKAVLMTNTGMAG